jgi:hypothetical protein
MMIMSQRELAIQLLENVPEYKIGYVIAYIQGLSADEQADDEFCEKMYQNYLSSSPADKETISMEEAAKKLGVDLNV